VDLAATRRERYEAPGALPLVEAAPLSDDLRRRDFTINAMAVTLTGDELGRLHDPHGGRADLEARLVRILHPASFVDDPTRLLRAVRYEARLGFSIEEDTKAAALEAVGGEALRTVSGPRIRDELLDLLGEMRVRRAVGRLAELGLDRGLHSSLRADPQLTESAALAAGESGADPRLAALAALIAPAPRELDAWLEELHLGREPRDRTRRAAIAAPDLVRALRTELQPSGLYALLHPEPPEALALALALGAPPDPVLRYVRELRGVQLEITGAELVEAGVEESPVVGRALAETLRRKLDGEISGRAAELRAALELARSAGGAT
jgi:tRNA nucleotidyltransferase (CCA-adding enzyme)